jgi:hypothetical protein
MSRRTIAISLIVVGFLAILGVLYWTFLPFFQQRNTTQQPPALPSAGSQQPGGAQPFPMPTKLVEPAPNTAAFDERQTEELMKREASGFVERQGTYSNADGFASITTAYGQATIDVQIFLEAKRAELAKAHPVDGPAWGQTTRSLSSAIASPLPVKGKTSATVTVQAQQIVETSIKADGQTVSYQEYTLEMTLKSGNWLVSKISVKPLAL